MRVLEDGSASISQIIRKSITSKADLEKLCHKLGMNVVIDWVDNYDSRNKLNILNIDSDHIGGSHWISIYDDTFYFDPLGLGVARPWLNYLEHTYVDIQDPNYGMCGGYCVLFLYYASHGEIDKFYSLFNY